MKVFSTFSQILSNHETFLLLNFLLFTILDLICKSTSEAQDEDSSSATTIDSDSKKLKLCLPYCQYYSKLIVVSLML